jgi:DNA repair protein RadA/Sms
MGRCPACGSWGALVVVPEAGEGRRATGGAREPPVAVSLAELRAVPCASRRSTGFAELDRVLGGGLVAGSTVLLGGEPGIGKSTLLLQVADRVAAAGATVLYVSAEESPAQVGLRAQRLGVAADGLRLLAERDLARVRAAAEGLAPALLVIDSVQTVRDADLPHAAGSPAQVRRVAEQLGEVARRAGAAVVIVGHVTKDGALAGPKLLEHLVDVVLSFEGCDGDGRRVVRCAKNRCGSADEIGVFEMTGAGLADAQDVSAGLLARRARGAAGSAVVAVREGRRSLLAEVQALTAPSGLAVPRRTVVGVDAGRVALVAAVLERWSGLGLSAAEIFVSVAGGLRVSDPAVDLALAVAIASAHTSRPVPEDTVWVGEIGLCGDVREVAGEEQRVAEAARLGFARCVVPASARRGAERRGGAIRVVEARRVDEVAGWLREGVLGGSG